MFKKIKWFFQTLFRGYSDYDMNDYGRFACRKILPSLKHWVYKTEHIGYPESVGSLKEWEHILYEIVWAVEETAYGRAENEVYNSKHPDYEKVREIWDRAEKGMELFGKYFTAMWD